jgi:cell division inhibitor SepF
MSLFGKVKNFFAFDDEYEEEVYENRNEQEEEYKEQESFQERPATKQKLVSISGGASLSSKVVLIQPRDFAEAQVVADHLKSKRAVVINLQQMQIDQAKRFVDFLSGTVYAITGDIKKVGTNTFICTPDNVDISGTITDLLFEEEQSAKRW